MSDYTGFYRHESNTRDGVISPSIGDITDIFPAGMMDGLDEDLGFDAYELMKDCTNMSSSSIDRYFPGDNEEEFLKPGPSKRVITVKEEENLPPGIVKPRYPYACLIYLALKNSPEKQLTVSDIYAFITTNFPYFQYAQPGWKNSIRHNLSLNKSFEKNEQPTNGKMAARKTFLWAMVRGMEDKFENELNKFYVPTVKQWLACGDDYIAIRDGTKGLPEIEPKISNNENSNTPDMYKKLRKVIKQEAMDNETSNIVTAGTVRKVAEQTLGNLLNVKREAEFGIKPTKPRSRKSSLACNVVPKKFKHQKEEIIETPVQTSDGYQFDYTPLSNSNDLLILPETNDIPSDFFETESISLQENGNYVFYEDVLPTASSSSSSHDTYSDMRSDSSFSERNALFFDEQENKELRKHCNFTLNGMPFRRKFNFEEDGHYLKKKHGDNSSKEFGTENHRGFVPAHYQHMTFYPNHREDKENQYPN